MAKNNVPIFCEECRMLALANLENVPLCPKCLMAAVKASADPYVFGKIEPLSVSANGVKGLIKSRRKKRVQLRQVSHSVSRPK